MTTAAELRALELSELTDKLTEVEKALQKLRFRVSNEEENNVAAIRNHRRDRARIKHVMAEKRREAAQAK